MAKKSRAELLKEACEGTYGDFSQEQVKEEIARLNKVVIQMIKDKADENKSRAEHIKGEKDRIEYLVERLDYLRHEEAVANQLERE